MAKNGEEAMATGAGCLDTMRAAARLRERGNLRRVEHHEEERVCVPS